MSVLALGASAQVVSAQETANIIVPIRIGDDLSFSRVPPSLSPKPIKAGGFLLLPKLTMQAKSVSNAFYTDSNEQADIVIEAKPSLEIIKQYRDHRAKLTLRAKDQRYIDLTDENNTTYNASLNTVLTATKFLKIPLHFSLSKNIVSRSTPGSARFSEKPLYSFNKTAQAGVDYTFNRFGLKLLGNYERRSFDDGTGTTGQSITFSSNDRTSVGVSLIGSYDLLSHHNLRPEHTFYAGIKGGHQRFDPFDDGAGNDTSGVRSNKNIHMLAGFKTRYKDIIIGDVGLGYMWYDYDSNQAKNLGSYDISANISYLATPRLTFNFDASRDVNQDNEFVQGFVKGDYTIGAKYEFLHDLYGRMDFTYQNADFVNSVREDDTYRSNLGLRYIHSPRFESRVGLTYETRDSTVPSNGYEQTILRYGLTGRL